MSENTRNNRLAFVSIDMDTLRDYSIFCNIPMNLSEDRTLEITIPRFIDLFNELSIKATFFMIGGYAAKNKKYIKMLHENGHEIGSHTLSHKIDIAKLSSGEKQREIVEADKILSDIIGEKIVGFRAPNYLLDKETLDILQANGYLYDSSVFPTIMLPLHEFYGWFLIKRFCRIQWWMIFKPDSPYYLKNGLLEIPVSITPLTRLPFIGTYIQRFGWPYFNFAFKEISLFNKNINLELHPYEILSKYEDGIPDDFDILPGIGLPCKERLSSLAGQINTIKRFYQFLTLAEYAKGLKNEDSDRNVRR